MSIAAQKFATSCITDLQGSDTTWELRMPTYQKGHYHVLCDVRFFFFWIKCSNQPAYISPTQFFLPSLLNKKTGIPTRSTVYQCFFPTFAYNSTGHVFRLSLNVWSWNNKSLFISAINLFMPIWYGKGHNGKDGKYWNTTVKYNIVFQIYTPAEHLPTFLAKVISTNSSDWYWLQTVYYEHFSTWY